MYRYRSRASLLADAGGLLPQRSRLANSGLAKQGESPIPGELLQLPGPCCVGPRKETGRVVRIRHPKDRSFPPFAAPRIAGSQTLARSSRTRQRKRFSPSQILSGFFPRRSLAFVHRHLYQLAVERSENFYFPSRLRALGRIPKDLSASVRNAPFVPIFPTEINHR